MNFDRQDRGSHPATTETGDRGTGDSAPPGTAGSSLHVAPPGARFMNVLRWALFAALLVLAVASVGAYLAARGGGDRAGAGQQALYHCPMHPSYTSDRPGDCPICGMSLEPIGRDRAATGALGDVPGLTTVHLDPRRIQMIGVRTAPVARRPLGSGLELVGFVAPDESRLRRIQLRVAGWVQELHAGVTGERVRAGQPLLSIYSPELYQSEREYLIERGIGDGAPHASPPGAAGHVTTHEGGALTAARQRLRLLGVPDDEIERLDRERTAATRLTLRAPVTGTVLERNVVEGQYVAADTPLFGVADLSRVWVLADLYELDFGRVRAGTRVRFAADARPEHGYAARVDFVYPTVSSETRTLKVRIAIDNADGLLRPGMYGRVRVLGDDRVALAVPAEAVVDAGDDRYLFVAHGDGHFEPRRVATGARDGEWVEILRGVSEGDTVVASASFLIDSESRLKAAIAGMGRQPAAPDSGSRP